MPAPRACRSCGADLAPDVRWCVSCFTPVTAFAPRPSQPGTFVATPRHDLAQSRWAKSPTSFGPRGRIVETILTIALGPWTIFGGIQFWNPFFLWYFCGYMLAAVPVLKHIWSRVPVAQPQRPTPPDPGRLARRHPILFTRIQPNRRATVLVFALLVTGGAAVAWTSGGPLGRYTIVVIGVMTAVGMLLAWLAEA